MAERIYSQRDIDKAIVIGLSLGLVMGLTVGVVIFRMVWAL